MRGDQTFVELLGLDCPAFTKLLRPFAKLFTQFDTECQPLRRKKIKSSVRLTSRSMTADGCLALALMFLSSEAEVKLLGVLFWSGFKVDFGAVLKKKTEQEKIKN